MTGVLVVDKPAGPTSHDVVSRARRALGIRRIGHTGTLDPLASGVLPLVVGNATRLARYLAGDEKAYVADVRFGVSTPTGDAASAPDTLPDTPVDRDAVRRALDAFRGTFRQRPPRFSAKKIAGTRAYELARRGEDPDLEPVDVTVRELELVDADGPCVRLRIVCSAGFYVRSLAHDLGEAVGTGAFLAGLRRTRAGAFDESMAVPLADLEALGAEAAERLVPAGRLLPGQPAVVLTPDGVRRTSHGALIRPSDLADGPAGAEAPAPIRLLDQAGRLVGLAEPRPGGVLQPVVVLV
jgi:tRNA pseudouridine55 synthase